MTEELDNSLHVGTHTAEVLRRFVARLKGKLKLNPAACFVAENPFNVSSIALPDRAYIVSFEGSSFNDGEQSLIYLTETAYVNVTCFNRLAAIDETRRADSLITKRDVNLFEMKRRALLALVGWRLELEGEEQDIDLASYVKVSRCGKPQYMQTDSGSHGAFLPLTFSVSYAIDVCNGDYNV